MPSAGEAGTAVTWSQRVSWTLVDGRPSLVAQKVKNLPAMQQTQVQCLAWEDPLEKGIATRSSVLAWEIPWTEGPWSQKGSDMTECMHTSTHTHIHTHP